MDEGGGRVELARRKAEWSGPEQIRPHGPWFNAAHHSLGDQFETRTFIDASEVERVLDDLEEWTRGLAIHLGPEKDNTYENGYDTARRRIDAKLGPLRALLSTDGGKG